MYCERVRYLLSRARGRESALPLMGQLHLKDCGDCAAFAEDLEFSHLLQHLPVAPASEGFTDRVLQQAWLNRDCDDQKERSSRGGMLAMAACLVLATGVALHTFRTGSEPVTNTSVPQVVQVAPQSVRHVNLRVVSAVDLPDAMITLRMDDKVSLAGYGESRELSWPASLQAGDNQLTLPVQLRNGSPGELSIAVEAQGASKEFTVMVEPTALQSDTQFLI